LSPARARNLLRWFLREQGLRSPSAARLADMLQQLAAARSDARTRIAHDGSEIGCHRGLVVVHAPPPSAFVRAWHGEAEVPLPGGTLAFEAAQGAGMAAAMLAQQPVTLRSRSGGERLQLAANRPRRAVKKLLQDAGLPSWQRQALPLVWCGDRLAAIPGIGIDLAFQAAGAESGWTVDWRPARRDDEASV
jgi:tRNA(Ile)-lysidine synthase